MAMNGGGNMQGAQGCHATVVGLASTGLNDRLFYSDLKSRMLYERQLALH